MVLRPVDKSQAIALCISAIIFLTMVIVGLDVAWEDFRDLLRNPRSLLVGFLTQTLFVPVSLGFVLAVEFPPALEAGILLLAICPMGSIANLYVSVGKGNVALSVTLALISGLLAFLTMPLWMSFFRANFGELFRFEIPVATLLIQLFFLLAFPIAMGMWLRARFSKQEQVFRRIFKRVALFGVLLLGGYIIFSDRESFAGNFGETALAAALLSILGMVVSFATACLLRLNRRDAMTLLLNSPVKNFGVAIAIAVSLLKQPEFALFATTTFMIQLPLFLAIAVFASKTGFDSREAAGNTTSGI